MSKDYQRILRENFIGRHMELYHMNYTRTAAELKKLESILFFGDNYWTPKFEAINSDNEAIKFVNLWFWINKKGTEKIYRLNPNDPDKINKINDLEKAEWQVMSWLDRALENAKDIDKEKVEKIIIENIDINDYLAKEKHMYLSGKEFYKPIIKEALMQEKCSEEEIEYAFERNNWKKIIEKIQNKNNQIVRK